MESLKDVLLEVNIDTLIKYIEDNNIDPDFALNAIKYRSEKKKYYLDENLKTYFSQRFVYDKNERLFKNIVKEFIKNKCINFWETAAKKPIKDDLYGFIDIDTLKNNTSGNLIKDFCKGWENTAHVLKNFTDSGSTAKGRFEVLLKFLLAEAVSGGTKGDVSLYGEKELEVKTDGAHACGQKNIKNTGDVYEYMKEGFLSIENEQNSEYKKLCDQIRNINSMDLRFFQNYDKMKNKNDQYVNGQCLLEFIKIIGIKEASKLIVNAIYFQNGKKYQYFEKSGNSELYTQTENHLEDIKNDVYGFRKILNVVGAIQLYFYSTSENFDYFICLDSKSSDGRYVFIANENKDGQQFLNFDFILKNFVFGFLNGTTTSQGRTGKMSLRK